MNYYDDIIDSRDIIERISELEEEQEDLKMILENSVDEKHIWEARENLANWNTEFEDELNMLRDFAEEAEQYCEDWTYGATLIKDSYFEEYAEQLAEDIGAIDRKATWPLNHIDWASASRDLQQDYSCVDFNGTSYWIR